MAGRDPDGEAGRRTCCAVAGHRIPHCAQPARVVGILQGEADIEVFERSRSKSSPLEQHWSKLANPVELTGFDRG